MAKAIDIDKLKAQMAKLQETISFQEQSQSKFINLATAIKNQISAAGLDLADVLPHLKPPRKPRAAKGSAIKRIPASLDSTGQMPERGTTYKHSSWPEPWIAKGKPTPKLVLKTIKEGKTWAQLKAK